MRAKRPCAEPGCATLGTSTRCPDHTRQRDRARGTRQERGYDAAHQARRRHWQARIDAGETVRCARCGTPITTQPWALDHTDDRTGYLGPSCATCNNRAGAIKRNTAN